MASTRARFTILNVTLVMGTVVAFAISLWIARRTEAQEERVGVLTAQAVLYADRILNDIRASQRLGSVFVRDPSGRVELSREVRAGLDRRPGYFLLIGSDSQVVYNSSLVRMLPPTDGEQLLQYATDLRMDEGALVSMVADPANVHRLFIITRRGGAGLEPYIGRIAVGLPDQDVELSGPLLLGTIFVLLPFVLIACTAAAYFMAGRVLSPMHELTDQLEAITDGRSLHRRLPPDMENDELARLTNTLNAMLSRLELSFAGLRRFTADASHELKTPLAVLRVDVERAMHPRTSREDRMVALEEALQEVTRMSDLVDSLLTLARADEGRFELAHEPVQIEPLLRDVYETATILGETAGLSIAMPTLADAVVMGERTRLRQLLLNLVTNAIKYTPRGGRVELGSSLRPNEIAITVRDTGIGISATDLPHIFDRFWRADRARSRAAERSGFGLGLAISQYIAQAHGGTLVAQSRLGRGTLFTVVLPAIPQAGESVEPPVAAAGLPRAAHVAPASHPVDSNSDFTDS
jgi:two-component system OmpR family sensor kinase